MYIQKIEIQYFRSIYKETIKDIGSLNVFTGKNDVGKSNILKALNLFFNYEADSGVPFVFESNFNLKRLEEVRQDSIKGKQYIQIKVTFIRGNRSEGTLPYKFTVTKKWFRNDVLPSIVESDIEKTLQSERKNFNARNKSSLTAYLNKIRYTYVPAIKDTTTFKAILSQLRETIYNEKLTGDKDLVNAMGSLANRVSESAKELGIEFRKATGIETELSSPKSVADLYQTLNVETSTDGGSVDLNMRGDGIRVRYLPSILHYIASNSSNMYIWGFEEPENSLEYNLALQMASDFRTAYSKKSCILVTSHSPAFTSYSDDEKTKVFRCFRHEGKTRILAMKDAEKNTRLAEELGHAKLLNELYEEYSRKKSEIDSVIHKVDELELEIASLTRPVVYTEGLTDVNILKAAWGKLFDYECPYDIKSCNVLAEEDGSAAGCAVLKELLKTTRPDNPYIIVGLFDRDEKGIDCFKLDNNFTVIADGWKTHKNKKSHAILLPTPVGKEQFAKYENLCIEFYFEKSDLDKKIDNSGLKLIPKKKAVKVDGKEIECQDATELHFHKIDRSTKMFFSTKIVESLPAESFVHFKLLFQLIDNVLSTESGILENDPQKALTQPPAPICGSNSETPAQLLFPTGLSVR